MLGEQDAQLGDVAVPAEQRDRLRQRDRRTRIGGGGAGDRKVARRPAGHGGLGGVGTADREVARRPAGHGGLGPSRAGGGQERLPGRTGQAEGVGEQVDGGALGSGGPPPLQIADGPHADTGPGGQLGLGEAGGEPVPAQQVG
ncbi:hypothetical protein B0E53_05713 [Micromonospora sp. MH33]|nr:hypothetical protein B0E53_05713 [Micromonospora sp. MH33]